MNEIQYEAVRGLRRTGPLKSNLSSAELQALWELKADDSIVILLADKGSATVMTNTMDYQICTCARSAESLSQKTVGFMVCPTFME